MQASDRHAIVLKALQKSKKQKCRPVNRTGSPQDEAHSHHSPTPVQKHQSEKHKEKGGSQFWPQSTSNATKSQNGQEEGYLSFDISPYWLQLTEGGGLFQPLTGVLPGATRRTADGLCRLRLKVWANREPSSQFNTGFQCNDNTANLDTENRNSTCYFISRQTCKHIWSNVKYFQGRRAVLSLVSA